MKKLIALVLCVLFLFCGCMRKSEPFYEETNDNIVFEPYYHYVFADDESIRIQYTNNTENPIYFYDIYNLEKDVNGTWMIIGDSRYKTFDTTYRHEVSPGSTSDARYYTKAYTETLVEGTTYRISTYCFDDEGHYWQVFAEVTCDDEKANDEIIEITNRLLEDPPENDLPEEFFDVEWIRLN